MSGQLGRICVFCGSSGGGSPRFAEAAAALGEEILRQGLGLVYGGGQSGLMGVLSDTVLDGGGEVIGVIPAPLFGHEIANTRLHDLRVVETMHERKALMASLADAFVALPGGYGTLEEFCEVLTWTQLGVHDKPCALLDVDGYWRPLVALFDRAVAEGFVVPHNRRLVIQGDEPREVLSRLDSWERAPVPRQVEADQT